MKILKRNLEKLSNSSATALVFGPISLGLLSFLGYMIYSSRISEPLSPIFTKAGLLVPNLCFAFAGIGMIIRREIPRPGHQSITGVLAIVAGIFWVLFFGGMGIAAFILAGD